MLSGKLLPIIALIFSASANGIAQLLWKAATNQGSSLAGLMLSSLFWGGAFLYGISILAWVYVLSRLPVSLAYPVLALSYIIVALGGYFVFAESMSVLKIAGLICIIVGIGCLAFSHQ